MIRIGGGEWKGQTLKAPTGSETRPTSAFLRESIFNMLTHGIGHQPMRVLDIFAGTGALGLEALSRGGESALFIEAASKTLKVLEANVSKLAKNKKTKIIAEANHLRWLNLLSKEKGFLPFDTIFCDPPYGKKLIDKTLNALNDDSLWADEAIFIAEMGSDEDVRHPRWEPIKDKTHSDSRVVIFRRLK